MLSRVGKRTMLAVFGKQHTTTPLSHPIKKLHLKLYLLENVTGSVGATVLLNRLEKPPDYSPPGFHFGFGLANLYYHFGSYIIKPFPPEFAHDVAILTLSLPRFMRRALGPLTSITTPIHTQFPSLSVLVYNHKLNKCFSLYNVNDDVFHFLSHHTNPSSPWYR